MRYFVMVAVGAILWGCWPLVLRPAGLSGPQSALLAMLVMALPTPFVLRREALRDRRATLALGVLGLGDAANAAADALTYLEPLTAALLGVLVFGEVLGPLGLLGALVVLVSGAWVASEPRGPAKAIPAHTGTG